MIIKSITIKEGTALVSVDTLESPYPQFVKEGMKIRCFINRIYNKDGTKIIDEPHRSLIFNIVKPKGYYSHCLDVSSFAFIKGIPKEYCIEIVAINFVYERKDEKSGRTKVYEFPIYPNETKTEVDYSLSNLKEQVEREIYVLDRIGKAYETIGYLYQSGLPEIANDLTEGLLRAERGDYEGV